MLEIRQVAVISAMVLGLAGCDGMDAMMPTAKGKADSTMQFWGRLQWIQWHGNRDILRLNEENVAAAKASDVDRVAGGFSMLAEKHSQLATQLKAIDANNVDEAAIDYRERLVAAHQALSEENTQHESATQGRDMHELEQRRSRLKTLLTEYVQVCNAKASVMSTLKAKYDRDFDVAE